MTKHRKHTTAPVDSETGKKAEAPANNVPKLKPKKEMEVVKPPNNLIRFFEFLKDARNELTRVTWPTRKETVKGTGAILILVGISAVYLGVVDRILSLILRYVMGTN